ncbi:hypothetical protein SLW70_05495 [Flavobacterium sp. NG2]|uniref:hypothetical protein n=1 Tax=Flavobacterium sp. NG2 TaxID=3097547 RepID=UPI002A821BFE|nr:hypothetical protein [Flavobacterium sp. NG2]WPR72591.1 hypothetical protein SLW70_05495 [Flavobacterium sp. NG2]
MNTRRIITGALGFLRNRRSATPAPGNKEELTNTRFSTTRGASLEKQKNVVNSLLLMYSKENETLFI